MNVEKPVNRGVKIAKSLAKAKENESRPTTELFTPSRFSVRGLRRHRGVKTSRTPRVSF